MDEWSTYLAVASSAQKTTPNEFWKAVEVRLPKLASAATSLLQLPAHSVDVERSFSKVKMLLTPQRLSLKKENVEQLLMLYHNASC